MNDLLSDLNLDNISSESLKWCFEEGENYKGPILFHQNIDSLEKTLFYLKSINQQKSSIQNSDISNLKKLMLYLVCSIFHNTDTNILIILTQCLIELCSLSGSAAYGILSITSLSSISSGLNKIVSEELKHIVANKNLKRTFSETVNFTQEDEMNDSNEDDKLSDTDVGITRSSRNKDSITDVTLLKTLILELQNKVHLFQFCPNDHPKELCIDGLIGSAYLSSMNPSYSDLEVNSALFLFGSASEKLLMCTLRSMIPALILIGRDQRILDSFKSKSACHEAAIKILVHFTKSLPIINDLWITNKQKDRSIQSNNKSTPDSSRNLDTPHSCVSDTSNVSLSTVISSKSISCDKLDTQSSSAINKVTNSNLFPSQYNCVIGVLQRIVLCVPDRAPMRSLAVESILKVVSALYDTYESTTDHSSSTHCLRALSHFMEFLIKLSKCNKTGYRAFSMDIITSILSTEWIWNIHSERNRFAINILTPGINTPENLCQDSDSRGLNYFEPKFLLTNLMERVSDVAPTVRIRALSALCGLFETLNSNSPKEKCDLLLSVALGSVITNQNDESFGEDSGSKERLNKYQKSILDIFRESSMDEKPLVRSKSIQALGSALTLNWPKFIPISSPSKTSLVLSQTKKIINKKNSLRSNNSQDMYNKEMFRIEYVTMFISEEDLQVIIEKCNDISLAVRKQAIGALSDLTNNRPADNNIQDAWVSAVLPMITDPESSVQMKVAISVKELILESVISWMNSIQGSNCIQKKKDIYQTFDSSTGNFGLSNIEMSMNSSTCNGWRLLNKIAITGKTVMLKSSISLLIKQGLLIYNQNGSTGTSALMLKSVMKSAKIACCCDIQPYSSDYQNNQLLMSNNLSFPHNDQSLSKSGWVLLEALVGQISPTGSLLSFYQTSADFVVKCFADKHKNKLYHTISLDDDDVRMLQVLNKLADTLSIEDINSMKVMILPMLTSMSLSSSAISASIEVMYTMSKVTAIHDETISRPKEKNNKKSKSISGYDNELITDLNSEVQKVWYDDVKNWCGPIISTAYTILEYFVRNKNIHISSHDSTWLSIPTSIEQMPPAELTQYILKSFGSRNSDDMKNIVKSAIFTLGEISMLGFSMEEEEEAISKHTKNSLLLSPNKKSNKSHSLPKYTISERSKLFRLIFPTPIITLVQLFMGYHLPLSNSSVFPSTINESISDEGMAVHSEVRAYAFITMGKFCLRDKHLAQNLVNLFLRELSTSSILQYNTITDINGSNNDVYPYDNGSNHADQTVNNSIMTKNYNETNLSCVAVRSNALLILGDLCVRYTHLIDRHVGMMAKCLQDEHVIVRKHAIILLTQLVLQDFLKWRGLFLYRFLATAADKDTDTAEFAKSVLKKTILSKYPDFFCQHFNEAIVVYNQWQDHPIYQAAQASGSEGDSVAVTLEGVRLSGPDKKKARFQLYSFMAEDFTEEHKIHVTAKIIDDILSYTIDSNVIVNTNRPKTAMKSSRKSISLTTDSLSYPFEDTLEDAFLILRSPLLKVGKRQSEDPNDDDVEISERIKSGKAAVAKAKSIVLKKLSRQHLVGHVLPVIMSLKHALESVKSPLQGSLMELLVSLVKSNKAEVDQALATDPCLKSEIEYDLKMFEKTNEKEKAKNMTRRVQIIENTDKSSSRSPISDTINTMSTNKKIDKNDTTMSILRPSLRKDTNGRLSVSKRESFSDCSESDEMIERLVGSSQVMDQIEDNFIGFRSKDEILKKNNKFTNTVQESSMDCFLKTSCNYESSCVVSNLITANIENKMVDVNSQQVSKNVNQPVSLVKRTKKSSLASDSLMNLGRSIESKTLVNLKLSTNGISNDHNKKIKLDDR